MALNLKPVKPKRIADLVLEQIRDLIYKGEVKPGEQIMPERELAELLEVSRPTIREAIQRLVSMGLLEQRQGQGTFVRSPVSDSNPFASIMNGQEATLEELLEVRMGLECNAAVLAAQRATEEDIADLKKHINAMIQNQSKGGLGNDADVSFHMAIAFASKNKIQINIMRNLYALLFHGIKENLNYLYTKPENIEEILRTHNKIYESIKDHDPEGAYYAMREHIEFVLNFVRNKFNQL